VFKNFEDFMSHTITERMGGSGLDTTRDDQIATFLEGQPAPENANLKAQLTDAQARGQAAFEKAQCSTCHSGQYLTNMTQVEVKTGDLLYDVPSLKGLARSAPYEHDGRASTIVDRVNSSTDDKHGDLTSLNTQEKADLVEYLKTL
jgi:cytochrome c peroxidase